MSVFKLMHTIHMCEVSIWCPVDVCTDCMCDKDEPISPRGSVKVVIKLRMSIFMIGVEQVGLLFEKKTLQMFL